MVIAYAQKTQTVLFAVAFESMRLKNTLLVPLSRERGKIIKLRENPFRALLYQAVVETLSRWPGVLITQGMVRTNRERDNSQP